MLYSLWTSRVCLPPCRCAARATVDSDLENACTDTAPLFAQVISKRQSSTSSTAVCVLSWSSSASAVDGAHVEKNPFQCPPPGAQSNGAGTKPITCCVLHANLVVYLDDFKTHTHQHAPPKVKWVCINTGVAQMCGCLSVCPTKYPLLNQRDLRGVGNIIILDIRNMRPVCYAINLTADQVVSSCAGSKHPYQALAPSPTAFELQKRL